MIQLGQRVRFDPFSSMLSSFQKIECETIGTVVYVNQKNKWFSVRYGENLRTSFKFSEIGQNVHICK